MLKDAKIGFIGGGQMCSAIVQGTVRSGGISAGQVLVTDISAQRLQTLADAWGVGVVVNDDENTGAKDLAGRCDAIVLAVKPQYSESVMRDLAGAVPQKTLVISIMGGYPLEKLEAAFPDNPVIRVMPNTPMLVGKGVAGMAPGSKAGEEDVALATDLFKLVGTVHLLDESLIDPLTALSGCGPAYAYLFMEAMADGGVELGLARDTALQLAAQTLAGAAAMVLQTGQHPGVLKDSVTSPGGGTIVGVHTLEQGAFRATVMDAVAAAAQRMEELA